MKKILIVISVLAILILSGCSKSSKINNDEIKSVKVEVISSSIDNKEVFTLIPIYISTGKSGYFQYIPYWEDVKTISLKYRYKNEVYKTNTEDFKLVEISGTRYAKIDPKDIGKIDAAIVIYTK